LDLRLKVQAQEKPLLVGWSSAALAKVVVRTQPFLASNPASKGFPLSQ
jgi:hypothetical protein